MRSIPEVLIQEKAKRASAHPWVMLIDVEYDTDTWLYFTNFGGMWEYYKEYHDDYVGDRDKLRFPHDAGNEYTYIPFMVSTFRETDRGGLSSLQISIDNTLRLIESYLHTYDLAGKKAILRLVNLNYMTSEANALVDYFRILGIESGPMVIFTLGHIGLLAQGFGRTMLRSCTFWFKDSYCGYAGAGAACNRVLGTSDEVGDATAASGTATMTGQPTAGNTFVIDVHTFTVIANSATRSAYQVKRGKNVRQFINNMAQAINEDVYDTVHAQAVPSSLKVLVTANAPGVAGNSIVFTENLVNATFDGGGTLGGTTAGSVAPEEIGTGDGVEDTFSLGHTYVDPVFVWIYVDGIEKTQTTHYTLDAAAGEVTFTAGNIPGVGEVITAGYRYYVDEACCRFYQNQARYGGFPNIRGAVQ